MRTNLKTAWITGLAVVSLGAGCATTRVQRAYQGAERAPAELATVWGSTNQGLRAVGPGRERIYIMSVDDESTVPWYSMASAPAGVQVLPGRHKVGVRYEYIHGVANGDIWVDASAGQVYQVKVLNPDDRTVRVYFVIENITAQSLVGGTQNQNSQGSTP